jgi:hypothetical protein
MLAMAPKVATHRNPRKNNPRAGAVGVGRSGLVSTARAINDWDGAAPIHHLADARIQRCGAVTSECYHPPSPNSPGTRSVDKARSPGTSLAVPANLPAEGSSATLQSSLAGHARAAVIDQRHNVPVPRVWGGFAGASCGGQVRSEGQR